MAQDHPVAPLPHARIFLCVYIKSHIDLCGRSPINGPLKWWRPPRVYLLKVLPSVEQGWHYVFGTAPSPVHLYEFIGVWVSAEHLNSLCVRHWVLGVLHTPSGRVVPIHLGASFHA